MVSFQVSAALLTQGATSRSALHSNRRPPAALFLRKGRITAQYNRELAEQQPALRARRPTHLYATGQTPDVQQSGGGCVLVAFTPVCRESPAPLLTLSAKEHIEIVRWMDGDNRSCCAARRAENGHTLHKNSLLLFTLSLL
jgi:hypothetical protein